MKKKDAFQIAATGLFLTTMVGIILFAFKKNKNIHKDISLPGTSAEKENVKSYSVLSLHQKIEQKINKAATRINTSGNSFSIPVGEFGTFL